MAVKRDVSIWQGLKYRGGGTMGIWILHRISGLAMIVFISLHILAGFLTQQSGSDLGIWINTIYESTAFQVGMIFFVLFHALNGARILLLDASPRLLEYQREMIWLQWLVFVPIYGLTVFIMISRSLAGG